MTTIIEKYILGLKQAYVDSQGKDSWEHFEKVKHGAANEDIASLKDVYPDVPEALISLLKYVDGTYWRQYNGEKIAFYLLGSDVKEYPYYLLSTKQIIENRNQASNYFTDYIERNIEEVEVDDHITRNSNEIKWIHFSDCMNNGGTSQLFIDLSPSALGVKGQVVRYLHDPDELKVIAHSFESYLELLMVDGYNFISDDIN